MNPIHYHSLIAYLIILFAPGLVSAQRPDPVKLININSVSVFIGFEGRSDRIPLPKNFGVIGAGSLLIPDDLDNFGGRFAYIDHLQPMYIIMLGINFADTDRNAFKRSPTLRVGINYSSGPGMFGTLHHTERYPYDTLVSPSTGQLLFLDSISRRDLLMAYHSEQLRLDISLLFQTHAPDRISMFAGLGLMAGFSLNALTTINYNERSAVEGYVYGSMSRELYAFPYSIQQYEYVTNQTNSTITIYVPLGLEYRLSDRSVLWRRILLFYEARPMYSITSIPELGRYNQTGIQHGIGVRVKWD